MNVEIGDMFSYRSEADDVICKICHQFKSKDEFSVEEIELGYLKRHLIGGKQTNKNPYGFYYFYSE